MNILRTILVGLASFTFVIAVTGLVYLLTLQTTIMDRTVVKSWLNESQLYDGRLINTLVQTTNAGGGPNDTAQPADNLSPSPEAVKSALNATFTPAFTRTQLEGVVDNAYNWIDGTSPTFSFSIPIDQKRDTLIAELAKRVEPKLAALPVCRVVPLTQQPTCRPADTTASELAIQLTTQSIDDSGAFAAPITNESFSKNKQATAKSPGQPTISQLPAYHNAIELLLLILPIVAAFSLFVIIFATKTGLRLVRVARLSRRIFFGMLFIFIPTAIVIWLARDSDLGLSNLFAAQTSALVVPLLKTILVGILTQLALFTGIGGLVSVITWIVLSIIKRSRVPSVTPPTPVSSPTPATVTTPAPMTRPQTQPSEPPISPAYTQQLPSADREPDTTPTNYQR